MQKREESKEEDKVVEETHDEMNWVMQNDARL